MSIRELERFQRPSLGLVEHERTQSNHNRGHRRLGRTVQIIDPTLDASFVRYQDDLHEVRVYTGWKADSSRTSFSIPSGETLPPTQVTIDDLTFVDPTSSDGESYSESFTM